MPYSEGAFAMYLHYEANGYDMFAEPMASAYFEIVALFLVVLPSSNRAGQWLDVKYCSLILQKYTIFRQFSLTEVVNRLQECAIELRSGDLEGRLRRIAHRTFQTQNLEAIRAALELLDQQGLICEPVWHMLFRMANALGISNDDLDDLIARFF